MKIPNDISEGDLIEVRFYDICQDSDWQSLDSIRRKRAPRGKAAGYFLEANEERLVLLSMVIVNGRTEASDITFPVQIIISVRRIEEAEIDDFR